LRKEDDFMSEAGQLDIFGNEAGEDGPEGVSPAVGKTPESHPGPGVATPALIAARERRLERAAALGLVAKWADYKTAKGHIAMHDPGSGEWVEVLYADAPGWAQREARKRTELYRQTGDARVFDYDAATMRSIWEGEQVEPEDSEAGIVEEYELPND
jgi:hypothetical protein